MTFGDNCKGAAIAVRVVHIDSGKYWRGCQKQIWLLSRAQMRQGIDCWVVGHPNSPLFKQCCDSNIPTLGVKVRFEVDLLALANYLRVFAQLRPTIVNIHCSRTHLPAGWAAKLAKVPLVLLWRWLDNPIRNTWQKWKYQQGYDAVVTISQRVAQVLQEGGVSPIRDATPIVLLEAGLAKLPIVASSG